MAHVLNTPHFSINLTARLRDMVADFSAARSRRAAFNQAYTELQKLSDQELIEFGLHRSDLTDLARVHCAKS